MRYETQEFSSCASAYGSETAVDTKSENTRTIIDNMYTT